METNEYIKLADVEDRMWYFRSLHAHVHRAVVGALGEGGEASVLDAGCGTGGLILRLQTIEPGWKFTGIDFSQLACDFAAKRCPDARIRQASITELPFEDRRFDAIVSADVVCQVDDHEAAFREFFRCVRPGGVVVINVPAYKWMWSYHDETCQTKRRYGRRELASVLEAAGFCAVRATHWNMLPFPLLVMKRKLFRTRSATSDVRMYPAPLEAAFNGMMAMEHAGMRAFGGLPFGSSVVAVARKPA